MTRFSREASASTPRSDFPPSNAAAGQRFSGESRVVGDGLRDGRGVNVSGSPEEARRMLDEVQQLGTRMRLHRRRAQQIDRRAAAYASRLARHTARLLEHMPNALPAVRPVAGTGASTLRHYVLKHDELDSPDRTRLLVVSSDGRLRVCTVLSDGRRSRYWADYDVSNPPPGLELSLVFQRLSSMIVKLECAVQDAEIIANESSDALDDMIAATDARLFSAGSRIAPQEDLTIDEVDAYTDDHPKPLKSYGFEHRLPGPAAKLAAAPAKPGRFAR